MAAPTFTPSSKSFSQIIDGFPVPWMFSEDLFRSAVNYKPRTDDIILATYPKCGTTWTQYILALIFSHGEPIEDSTLFQSLIPLEMTGPERAEKIPRPGAIKVHLPYHLAPRSDVAKYIYVARNPMDCCVSYFHHMKNVPGHPFKGNFDEFFEFFISGNIDYGDYFDHLLGWYAHRNNPNVWFMTYEQLKEDTGESILKLASFLDEKLYAEPLRNDPEKLQNVIKYSRFEHMKQVMDRGTDAMRKMSKEDIQNAKLLLPSTKDFVAAYAGSVKTEGPSNQGFVRKGIIGDWKNYFNDEQRKKIKAKFAERTKDTDIPKLFEKYMM